MPDPTAPFQASLTPDVVYQPPPDTGLALLYADEAMIVVDKPAGLLSVPGRGEGRLDCMASRVQQRFADALIVHRLDMATSGLLVLARGPQAQRSLSYSFQSRQVSKRYVALVHGLVPDDEGEVDAPLITDWPRRPMQMVCTQSGKPSLTRYQVLAREAGAQPSVAACAEQMGARTRVELEPVTGRSHQLRVHMLHMGHAIVGDPLYGDAAVQARFTRLMLHACAITLPHPVTGTEISLCSAAPF
jgi:tRNA pseudouridine32 synthase/23S rRNA pseudouridine746 synthase